MKPNWLLSTAALSLTLFLAVAPRATALSTAVLFDNLIPLMMSPEDKILFDHLQLSMAMQEQSMNAQTLNFMTISKKTLQAKIELLATMMPLPTEHVQHLHLQTLNIICRDLYHEFDNKQLIAQFKSIAKKEISSLSIPVFSRLLGRLNCFSYDYYTEYPELYDSYAEIIQQYRMGSYTQTIESFLETIDKAVRQHEKARQESQKPESKKILILFTSSLLKIKEEILSIHPYNLNPQKISIWISYLSIKKNPKLHKLLANKEFAAFYNTVQKIITNFTSNTEFSSLAACEMASTLDELQKYLKHNQLSTLVGLYKNQKLEYMLISQMAAILENIREYVLQNTQDPFIRSLLKLTVFEPKTSQEDVGAIEKVVIELAQQLAGKKFANIKDAVLYLAAENREYLLGTAIKFAGPAVREKIQQLMLNLVDKLENKDIVTPIV